MSEQKAEQDKDIITRLAMIIGIIGGFLGGLMLKGAFRRDTWAWSKLMHWGLYLLFVATITFARNRDLPYWIDHLTWVFPKSLGEWVYFHISPTAQFTILSLV